MASTARAPAAQTVLPDEIWEEILLRVDAAADLARASASCSSFRRIVSQRRFLRRFRTLHSPPLLGFISRAGYGFQGFLPVGSAHRSAPEARTLEQAADFTFAFLPDAHAWRFRHARDDRVLLLPAHLRRNRRRGFPSLRPPAPPVRQDSTRTQRRIGLRRRQCRTARHLFPVLAPAGENDEEESFRVICTVQLKGKVAVFIFSSCNQTWRGIISTIDLANGLIEYMPDYAHGCVHWMLDCMGYSLMLDTSEMEFSIIDLPPTDNHESKCAILEIEEGRLGLVTIGDDTIDLYCKNWQNNGVAGQDWQHEKLIPLPKDSMIDYGWDIVGTAGHYVAVLACCGMHCKYFVLDIKTLLLEELCTLKNSVVLYGFPYARFPPPLALPSI